MPNNTLERSSVARSSSIHIEKQQSFPDNDNKTSPLASLIKEVNNSPEGLNTSDSESNLAKVVIEERHLHNLASTLKNTSHDELSAVSDQTKSSGKLPYLSSVPTATQAQPAMPSRYALDLTNAIPTSDRTATSSGGSFYKLGNMSCFIKPVVAYVPLTNQQQEYFASSEVASNTLTRLLTTGTEGAPRSFIGALSGVPYIATETINFKDLGRFFSSNTAIDDFAMFHPEMKTEDITKLKDNAVKITGHYEKMENLEKSRPNDWWQVTDQEFVDGYRAEARPLRELIIESLKTLPVEIQKMVQEHIVIGQIVGDWDFLNERFENIGISKNSDGQYRVASLDRGSSFGVGFWGKSKPEGYSGAVNQRPPAFLPLNSAFVQEKAVFGSDLAALGKDFSYMPYGDVAKLLSGKAEWLPETLKKIAYRITVANDHDLIHKILKDTLMDVSDAGLEERHFLSKAQTESILGARLRHAIEQAGGYEAVQRWAQQNTTEAARIAGEVASIRESLGYDF